VSFPIPVPCTRTTKEEEEEKMFSGKGRKRPPLQKGTSHGRAVMSLPYETAFHALSAAIA
jgi:hypothetical protein